MSDQNKIKWECNTSEEGASRKITEDTIREDCRENCNENMEQDESHKKAGLDKSEKSEKTGKFEKDKNLETDSEGSKSKDENVEQNVQSEETIKGSEEEALNMKYMRLMADFQNFKRRTEKEKSDIYAFANEKIVSELLDVIDNFERALSAAAQQDSFSEGMELIFKQLQMVLEKAGVVEIEALGADFDPNFHNAVMMEASTQYESGKVTCVLQKGYLLNNRVIRPSMVKVAN